MRRAGRTRDITPRTTAGIDKAVVTQMFPRLEVERATFALQEWAFVPLQAKPSEILENGFAKFRSATVAIQIFDSQDQSPVPGASSAPARARKSEHGRRADSLWATARDGRDKKLSIPNSRFQIAG